MTQATATAPNQENLKPKRNGIAHTVYFSKALTASLNDAALSRRVGKSTIVRIAVEQLLKKLESGQLELPLGL
jgi:hypothetical protein